MVQAKPFLKWAGGKQSIAREIIDRFPRNINAYYEPFIGGGSVYFALKNKNSTISDANSWLIDTYKAIRDRPSEVTHRLDGFRNCKEFYLETRAILPESLTLYDRAAAFIYLNKTCFRGLFRVNRKGMFNVPWGDYDRRYYDPQNIERASNILRTSTIRHGDFESAIEGIEKGDFVYFDPPYYKAGGHSDFNRYTENPFVEKDQSRLASLCNKLDIVGIKWAVSNSNTEFIKQIYRGYTVHGISARREINIDSSKRNTKELLITNY